MSTEGHTKVRIYTPEPVLKHPGAMLREMLHDVWQGRGLAWRLFVRDMSAQYRQTYLGYIWAFLPPLIGSLTFIFLNSQGIVNIEGVGMPYAAFAMIGTLLWQTFVEALQSPSQSIAQARPMLAKINFPREAILLSGIYMVFFNFAIRLILLVGVLAWWRIVPGVGLLFFPITTVALVVCGLALGLLIAPLGSLYGDVARGIPIAAQFLMLLTPVVYPPRATGLAGWLSTFNPVSPLLTTARESLSGDLTVIPLMFWIVLLLSILMLTLGWIGFRLAMPHLIERMGG